MGISVFFAMRQIKAVTLSLIDDVLPGLVVSADLQATTSAQQLDLLRHLLSEDQEEMRMFESRIETRQYASDKLFNRYKRVITDEEENRSFQKVVAARIKYRQIRSELLEFSRTQPVTAVEKYHRVVVRPRFEAYQSALNQLYQANSQLAFKLTERIQSTAVWTGLFINILCIVSILLGVIFTIWLVFKVWLSSSLG